MLTGLTPSEREAVHALALGGVSFEPEDRRVYPLGTSAVHLIGDADTGGQGVAGAELAFNDEVRAANQVVDLIVPGEPLEPNGPGCPPICFERYGQVLGDEGP